MTKTGLSFDPNDYAPVADRISLFYERFPTGRITTSLISREDGEVTFKAFVYRSPEEAKPAATGWAAERVGDGEVNEVACLENTETSAIGRALANLGFTASRQRPSREEMIKAARAQIRSVAHLMATHPYQAAGQTSATPIATALARVREPAVQDAERVQDLLEMVTVAERSGLSSQRVRVLRQKLHQNPPPNAELLDRIENRLRTWLERIRRNRRKPAVPA